MQNVEIHSSTLFRLRDNLLAHQTSSGELAVRAGEVLLYIEGPPDVVVNLFQHVGTKGSVSFEDVLATSGLFHGIEEAEAASQLWTYLVENRILVPEEPSKTIDRDSEVLLLTTGEESENVLRYLLSVLGELEIRHSQKVAADYLDNVEEVSVAVNKSRRLTVAGAIGEHDLYRLNRRMLTQDGEWCYFETLSVSNFVSPVIGQPGSPCYECIRLRRIGALPDLAASAVFEAKLKQEPPAYRTPARRSPSLELGIAALLMERIVEWAEKTHSSRSVGHYIGRSGAIRPGTVYAVPNCPACRQTL